MYLSSFKPLRVVLFLSFSFFGKLALSQNNAHPIIGYSTVCPGSEFSYSVDPPYDYCETYKWTVHNGRIIGPSNTSSVQVLWDEGVTSGKISYEFNNCVHNRLSFPSRKKTFNVEIWDYSLLEFSFFGVKPNCNTSEFAIGFSHADLDVSRITNITWEAPSGWSIKPNSQSGSGQFTNRFGRHFRNVKMVTRNDFSAPKVIKVTYSTPSFGGLKCRSKTIQKLISIDIQACPDSIYYSGQNINGNSHSNISTVFAGVDNSFELNQALSFAAGEVIEIGPENDFPSDSGTGFDFLVQDCTCSSKYLDPSFRGPTNTSVKTIINSSAFKFTRRTEKWDFEESRPNFRVYPNPFKDYLFIEGGPNKMEISELALFDVAGRRILNDQIKVQLLEEGLIVNTSDLVRGIYFLRIKCEGQVFTYPVIKQL